MTVNYGVEVLQDLNSSNVFSAYCFMSYKVEVLQDEYFWAVVMI